MFSSQRVHLTLVSLVLSSSACADVDPAPTDLDGIAHYFWANYDEANDEALRTATQNLHATTNASALDEARQGGLTDLTPSDAEVVGLSYDPAVARGMYLLNVIPCSLDQIEGIVYALNQHELYKDVYKSYERRYTSDFDGYVARSTPILTWDVSIAASILGSDYTEEIKGGLRRIEPGSEGTPTGPILLSRTYMPGAAQFSDSEKQFTQDYQIEVYYQRTPGEVVHFYGMWRHMVLGTVLDLDTDDDRVITTILDGLQDWDEKTAELCSAGIL